ncbi:MAG: lipoate--protein ligase family protein [Thermoplasmata archaeon]
MPDPLPAPEILSEVRCAEEFVEDERRLRAGVPHVRVVTLADLAVSVGVGLRTRAPFIARAEAAGIPVVRRTSGGSGVLHLPGEIAWSVVLPRSDPRVGRDFARAYARLGHGVARFLADLGVPVDWIPSPEVAPDLCVLSGRGDVLSTNGRILGGAAQHLAGRALLHQGMISVRVDRPRIAELFGLLPALLEAWLTSLEELGVRESPPTLAAQLGHALVRDLSEPSS